mgnify:CR=1 FL=1
MNCPFRNFEECPEHNKKGGCSFWLSYATNREGLEAQIEGCAVTLTPMLLLENANNLGAVAGEVNKVGAEISAGRSEAVKNGAATRAQLLALACGERGIVEPDYSATLKIATGKV